MKRKMPEKLSKPIAEAESSSEVDEEDEIDESEHSGTDNDCALDASATESDEDESDTEFEDGIETKPKTSADEDEIDKSEDSGTDNNCALDASATESDEDESDADLEDGGETKPKTRAELIKEELIQKYKERQGKQLYLRFPHKLPETQEELEEKVKELSNLVVRVHKPRQRHARFCLVDFATKEDRNLALKKLQEAIKKGDLKKYVVDIPKTESEDMVNEIAERKIKSIENKKAKNRLKNATKKALVQKNFTTSIIVLNLPKTSSVAQLRELFPNAVDIQIKAGKGKLKDKSIGAITLPTTLDARKATKTKLSLGGNNLIIKFDNQKNKKKSKSKSKSSTDGTDTSASEPKAKMPRLELPDDKDVSSKKENKSIKNLIFFK